MKPYPTAGRFKKGSKPVIDCVYKEKGKYCVLGARTEKEFIASLSEILNIKVFKEFVKKLLKRFGKIVMVMDGAPYHFSKEMQTFFEEHKDYFHKIQLPAHSPELNVVELSWRELKKWLGTRVWFTIEELLEELVIGLQKDFMLPTIYDYLRN